MSQTALADVQNQIIKYWAPLYTNLLRERHLLGALVNKAYFGEIKDMGDTVKVSQVDDPDGELLTAGVDADQFNPEKATTQYVDVTANKRAVVSYQFESLVKLQSQLASVDFQNKFVYGIEKQINTYLYSLVSPSLSAPDHDYADSSIGLAEMAKYARLASEAKWPDPERWFALFSPQYWETINTNTTFGSRDFVDIQPVVSGVRARKISGINCYEDNSRTGKYGIIFHPDFLYFVMQQAMQMKVSDLHGNKQFAYVISGDVVFGAKLGLEGALKHIRTAA